MIELRALLLAAAVAAQAVPAVAADAASPLSGGQFRAAAKPSVLSASERSNYREVFAAIRSGDWAGAATRLGGIQEGPLHAAARAELYLAKGSPLVSLDQLAALLTLAPDLPKAAQLARLAETRGAVEPLYVTPAQTLVWAGSQPRRARPSSVKGDAVAERLDPLVQPLIVDNQPAAAEALLIENEPLLSDDAKTEFRQRIAWSYYIVGDDQAARRLGDAARAGSGDWAVQAAWTSGLASWRMKDCGKAADAFAAVAGRASDVELSAAGHYWAARADMLCQRPERVQARLRSAARLKETFYGLLAASALGIKTPNYSGLHNFKDAEWRPIVGKANVKAAIALAEIGENELADEFVKHQARISPADHAALLHLASDLNLPATQYWLAHNAPRGAQVNLAARYPSPDWKPVRGWRVDQALAYAHALQESSFRTSVVSPAGAVGLMQVRPGTAGDIARSRGEYFDAAQLKDPAINLEYGQSYIEYLRGHYGTGGLLPKVIAAYNAGPVPVSEWNARSIDRGDPLLYVESIPYWETRGYVPIILRNYWIYEQQAGKSSTSRQALAQGLWPRFPGLPGPSSVRLSPPPAVGGARSSK